MNRSSNEYGGGYTHRGQLRRAWQDWLAQTDANLFVTVALAENVGIDRGRAQIKRWFAFIDSYYLGRRWSTKPSDERTLAFVFLENVSSNLHYHGLMRLPPRGELESLATRSATLMRLWQKIEPRGTCTVDWIRDRGASRYATKQLVRPGYLDQIILASDFHRTRN